MGILTQISYFKLDSSNLSCCILKDTTRYVAAINLKEVVVSDAFFLDSGLTQQIR
jgi:hypothetical protein